MKDTAPKERRALALNLLCLLLLVGILVGVFTIPRFNYEQLVAAQTELLTRQRALEDRFGTISPLTAESEPAEFAVLSTVEEIPSLLESLREEFSTFASIADGIIDLDRRVTRIEQAGPARDAGSTDASLRLEQDPLLRDSGYLEPIQLERTLELKSRDLSARQIHEADFEEFVASAIESGILPFDNPAVAPREVLDSAMRYFSLFKLNMMLVDYRERLCIQELAQQGLETGDYDEVPFDAAHQGVEMPRLTGPGVVHVTVDEDVGVKRAFRFSYDDHPELLEFAELRENAKNHLVHDVARTGAEWGGRPTAAGR